MSPMFTLSLNPVAWQLKATEGYRLSKPISAKITDVLYTDDMKMYAASEGKLGRVMKETRGTMSDTGLRTVERDEACSTVVHVKRGQLEGSAGMRTGASVNQEFEPRFPVPMSRSTREQETGRQHSAREY